MNKDDVLTIMLDSINEDNKALCLKAGLTEAEADAQIDQSQPSLGFIMSNVYDKLKAAGAIA